MLVRPLREEDLPAAAELSRPARAALPGTPGGRCGPTSPDAADAAAWLRRTAHLLRTDPGGCWAADGADGGLAGIAVSLRRKGLWGLSALAVRPGDQGAGTGRALVERALSHGAGVLRGMVCSSPDSRAVRLYRVTGHRLHPAMVLRGTVERSALPVVRHVRDGGPGDVELADAVDWLVRGAPHGPDHAFLAGEHPLLVAETATGRGYAYVRRGSEPFLLAATDVPTARELLWEALARAPLGATVAVDYLTAEQEWAVDVGIRAGLHVLNAGFVCLRGMRPPVPYVPSAAFL